MHILMVAAENGALKGGKVGGIGDVIHDVPLALARAGHRVTVITPGYGSLSKLAGAQLQYSLSVEFCGVLEQVSLFRVTPSDPAAGVEHWLVEHQLFSACGEGAIYCNDRHGPFATDAHKFALFCHAVCLALVTGAIDRPDVLHLHDWHAALLLFLRRHRYRQLAAIPTVYSIHNLSIQGIRPFANDGSALNVWYRILNYDAREFRDPRWPNCVNLMRMGINLADKVHAVSPGYAREILLPSDPVHGFVGGEGLEADLQEVARRGRLAGILNGCEYPDELPPAPSKQAFIELARDCLLEWAARESYLTTAFYFARQRLEEWSLRRTPDALVSASVSRLTAQKMRLMEVEVEAGKTGLEALLQEVGDGIYIVLGSGDPHFEQLFCAAMARHRNLLFLRGYSDRLSSAIYRFCDLFLMPSSFEPCGISQMLAMRAGKPCLVHETGGLKDTVEDGVTGFSFRGDSPAEQARQMVDAFRRARDTRKHYPDKWREMSRNAAAKRFSWDQSVREYLEQLYS